MAGFILALFHKLEMKYRGPLDIYKKCCGKKQGQPEAREDAYKVQASEEHGQQEARRDATAPTTSVRVHVLSVMYVGAA